MSKFMSSNEVLDLRTNKVGGCTGDPFIKLMNVLSEEISELHIIFQKSVMPIEVLRIILRKKGYELEILKLIDDDTILSKIYRSRP